MACARTWNPREDRVPSAIWLGILWVGIIAGFGADIPGFQRGNPPVILWVHGAVFTVWMLLLTAQVLLVLGDRVALHRKLGWFAVDGACLMAVMGPIAPVVATMQAVKQHGPFPYPFIAVHAVDLGGFPDPARVGDCTAQRFCCAQEIDDSGNRCACRSGILAILWLFHKGAEFRDSLVLLYVLRKPVDRCAHGGLGSVARAASALICDRRLRAATSLLLASFMNFWEPWKTLTLEWVKAWAKYAA